MAGAEGIVFALRAPGEARQAVALAQRADARAPAGQNLVRIGLMADIPDQPVRGRFEYIMKRDREFDDAKARAEVPAGDGDRIDRLLAQLVGELVELLGIEPAQIIRRPDEVQQGRL